MLPGDIGGFDDDDELLNLTNFKPMAEDANWYLPESGSNSQTPNPCDSLQLRSHPLDQSSCSQSPAFRLLAGATPDPLFGFPCESSSFDVDAYPLEDFVANTELGPPQKLSQIPEEMLGFDPFEVPPLPKALRPLELEPPEGAQPTLFQKRRAAMRKEGGESDKREDEERSGDGSVGNYETAEEEEGKGKGKGKGLPAKNLMAERRRRKKLNDRLYMLRSVVPKISKMDRASILGDAVDYLKELLQRINDLNEELKSAPPSGSMLPSTSNDMFLHTLAPTLPSRPSRIKEEFSSIPMASPGSQPARVEVRSREGREVNIHMFCARSPGLLLSTMRTLDSLGLDIQQAVISCFNGFSLDVFRAEQCKDGPAVQPEEIKTMLLHSTGLQGAMP